MSRAHAKFSASASARWLSCPGSVALSAGAPEQIESKYALEGTRAHECLEFLFKNRHRPLQAAATLHRKYGRQMVVYAEMALKAILARTPKGAELHSELKIMLPVSEPDQFGTADIVVVEHFGRLHVMDYKYGYVPVDPVENSQLIYYTLGVAHQFDYNFEDVEMTIIQPRGKDCNPMLSDSWVRSWQTSIDRLLEWQEIFEEGIKRAKRKGAPLHAGSHCGFCPAQSICPELKNKAMRSAEDAFAGVPLGEGDDACR